MLFFRDPRVVLALMAFWAVMGLAVWYFRG
jgi:hypothetical protein